MLLYLCFLFNWITNEDTLQHTRTHPPTRRSSMVTYRPAIKPIGVYIFSTAAQTKHNQPGDRVVVERGPVSPAVEDKGRSSGLTSGPSDGAAPSPHGARWRRTATARCSLLPTRPGASSPHTRRRRWRRASLSRAGHPPSAACVTGFLRRAPLLLEHRRPSRAGDGPRADRAGRRADLPKTGDASMAVEVCVVAAARRSRISLLAAQSRPSPHPCTMRPPLSPGRGGAARARHAGGGARARHASGGDRVRRATFRLGPDLTPRHARRG
jgi:hypothetical protein